MQKYTLKELLTIKNGRDHKHLADGHYPVYGSGGIMRYVDSYIYDKPSILLPRKGTLDNIQYCDVPFWSVDTAYYTEVKQNLCNPYYLYCYLNLLDLSNLNSGTGVPSMTFDSYYNIKVNLPTLEEQNKIANILQNIDRKIFLNLSIDMELEQMAKEIYDYWFVQFDFPDENGRPYKSSGGAMIYNSVLKREIPEGWTDSIVKNCIEPLQRGISYTSESIENPDGHPMLNLACYTKQGNYRTGEMKFYTGEVNDVHKAYPYDMLIACTDMTQGADIIGRPILATEENDWFVYSMDLAKIVPSSISKMYLYYTLRTSFYHKYIKPFASGTTVKHLNTQGVEDYKIVVPSSDVQEKFESLINPIKKEQMLLINNRLELEKQRSELLPLLMTGQVNIK